MLNCHAGCTFPAIRAAAGLSAADLRLDGTSPTREYLIRDATGAVVAIHERRETPDGKTFKWKHPTTGAYGLSGRKVVTLPLYGIEKLAGWPPDAPIVLCEGEKACEALWARGVCALGTVTGAATIPMDEVLAVLVGHPVILWADADDAGRRHMQRIAHRLVALGIVVTMVDWPTAPTGGDAADFTGDVWALLNTAGWVVGEPVSSTSSSSPSPSPALLRVRKASDVPDEQLDLAFGGRLVRGNFSPLVGPGDVGKGMIAVRVIAAFTTGDPFPGEEQSRPPMNVVMCVTEDSEARVKSRLRAAGADLDRVHFVSGPEVTVGGLTMPSPMMAGDDAAGLLLTAQYVHAEVLYLETIVEHLGDRAGTSHINTGIDIDIRRGLAPIRAVCQRAQLFGFGALHPRKTKEGSIADSISGAAALNNVGRGVMHVYRDPTDDARDASRLLCSSKGNYLKKLPRTLRFRIVSWDLDTDAPCRCLTDICAHEGRVVWGTHAELFDERSAEAIWAQVRDQHHQRRDVAVQEAEAFLTRVLAGGLLPLERIQELAKHEAISTASLKRAKEKLNVVSVMTATFPADLLGWQLPNREGGSK